MMTILYGMRIAGGGMSTFVTFDLGHIMSIKLWSDYSDFFPTDPLDPPPEDLENYKLQL